MNRLKTAWIVGGLLMVALTSLVTAISPGSDGWIARTSAAVPLSDSELQSRLEFQGYSNIQNVQHNGDRVVVTATKNGQTGELAVSPTTGKVMRDSDGDDNDDDD